MIDRALHPTPRLRDVVLEQIHAVGLALRREALVVAVVLGIVTLIIAVDIVRGNAATWFDSGEWFGVGVISFLFPFAVWRRERRFGPAFLWTLPVDRRQLALSKVFAGWLWMVTGLVSVVVWHRALAFLSGVTDAQTTPLPLGGATAIYLLGSALVLGLRHPLRWLLGAAGLLFLLGRLSDVLSQPADGEWQHVPGAGNFFSAIEHAAPIWQTLPDLAQLAILTFLWLGAGVAALWAAASRHGERRRQ